jgi:tRNA G18 (ribose-2'-O)-methylase SpoU
MIGFSQKKFSSFSKEKQHKKCAELLRTLYCSSSEKLLTLYNTLQEWMQEEPLEKFDEELVADRYHNHLKKAGRGLKECNFLPTIRSGDRANPQGALLEVSVYLDQIRSAHNVGSILRTVEAFQLSSVYFSEDTPFANHPQVLKAAMGSAEWVNCFCVKGFEELPKPLIALETCEEAETIDTFFFPKSFTLVLGNEERGCSKEILKKADHVLEIPLFGRKNSLNVANAFAIAAAWISQQLR